MHVVTIVRLFRLFFRALKFLVGNRIDHLVWHIHMYREEHCGTVFCIVSDTQAKEEMAAAAVQRKAQAARLNSVLNGPPCVPAKTVMPLTNPVEVDLRTSHRIRRAKPNQQKATDGEVSQPSENFNLHADRLMPAGCKLVLWTEKLCSTL